MAAPTPTPAPRARGRSSAGARVPARPGARPTNLILDSFGGSQKMNVLTEANWIYCNSSTVKIKIQERLEIVYIISS